MDGSKRSKIVTIVAIAALATPHVALAGCGIGMPDLSGAVNALWWTGVAIVASPFILVTGGFCAVVAGAIADAGR